ncbi:hypothetical protein [Wolbachia endosymbiont (group A) of Myopa testacea]
MIILNYIKPFTKKFHNLSEFAFLFTFLLAL